MAENFKTIEDLMRDDLFDAENLRSFVGRDILRVDYNPDEIIFLLETGRLIAADVKRHRADLKDTWIYGLGSGKMGATAFFENSTRTHDSSRVAMNLLGMDIPIERRTGAGTSQKKGEALAHDLSMYATYNLSCIVMRHSCEGSPQFVADYFDKISKAHGFSRPLIVNGGDGSHSHPTQALLDALTYYTAFFVDEEGKDLCRHLDRDSVMTGITLYGIGDSLKGRTIKDNARLLSRFKGNSLVLVGPEQIRMRDEDITELLRSGLDVRTLSDVPAALEDARTKAKAGFYFLRTQEERLLPQVVEMVRGAVGIDRHLLEQSDMLVMNQGNPQVRIYHPLPMHKVHREINSDLEDSQNFQCLVQAGNGPYMRAGLIGLGLGVIPTRISKKFVDPREPGEYRKFTKRDVSSRNASDEYGGLFKRLVHEKGVERFERFIDEVRAEGREQYTHALKEFDMFVDDVVALAAADYFRHLSMRFVKGEYGFVIDHIRNGKTGLVKYILGLSQLIGQTDEEGESIVISAVDGLESGDMKHKGVIKGRSIDLADLDDDLMHNCYLISPDLTFSRIVDGQIVDKFIPTPPKVMVNFINCKNPLCISRPEYHEHAPTIFYQDNRGYRCRYCDDITPLERIPDQLIKGE